MAVEFSCRPIAIFKYPIQEENAFRLKTPRRFVSLLGVRVDCFMSRGYLTGKRFRTPDLEEKEPQLLFSDVLMLKKHH